MRKHSRTLRILSWMLCMALIMQGGFVMPASADEDIYFDYTFFYREAEYIEEAVTVTENDEVTTKTVINPAVVPQQYIDYYNYWHESLQPHEDASNTTADVFWTDPTIDETYDSEKDENGDYIISHPSEGKVGETLVMPPEPYRIIGYTFDGWWLHRKTGNPVYDGDNGAYSGREDGEYRDNETGRITETTPITKEMLDGHGYLNLYSYWKKLKTADIVTGEFKIEGSNDQVYLGPVDYKNSDGEPNTFKSDDVNYTSEVYGNYGYVKLTFQVYEPDFEKIEITCTQSDGTQNVYTINHDESTPIYGDAYILGEDENEGTLVLQPDTVVHREVVTPNIAISNGANDIAIKVIMPETTFTDPPGETKEGTYTETDAAEKKYNLKVTRLPLQLTPDYGNTPYGEMMRVARDAADPDYAEENKASFNENYTYRYGLKTRTYTPNAWNGNDNTKTEKQRGVTLDSSSYYNYDKDDTLIFVYSASTFEDPGIYIYANGEALSPSGTNTIKRTINYPAEYGGAQELVLNGTENENVITLPPTLPTGMYTIDYSYEYTDDNGDEYIITADRNVVVMPKPGDWNNDGYVNSLDVNAVNLDDYKDKKFDKWEDSFFAYRTLDVNLDGVIDENDRQTVLERAAQGRVTEDGVPFWYRDLSVEEEINPQEYTYTEDDSKALMEVSYLGKGSDTENLDLTEKLEKDDIFWLGFSFSNLDRFAALKEAVNSMTLSVDYDSRFIVPASGWTDKITAANGHLTGYTFASGITNPEAAYTFDNSTAKSTWDDTGVVQTAIIDMYSGNTPYSMTDGSIFVKLPFTVKLVPPIFMRKHILTTKLGAKSFNISLGTSTAAMWDTSGKFEARNSATVNLKDKLGVKEVQQLETEQLIFSEPPDPIDLNEETGKTFIYGSGARISYNGFNRGKMAEASTLEGYTKEQWVPSSLQEIYELEQIKYGVPSALEYNPIMNLISGDALKDTGLFLFYIGGQPYSMNVIGTSIDVSAAAATKTYGDSDPTIEPVYGSTQNGDRIRDVIGTAPDFTIEDKELEVGDSAVVTPHDAEISDEFKEKYIEINYIPSTLTVNKQREITITKINNLASLSVNDIDSGNFTKEGTAVLSAGDFEAVLTDDPENGTAVLDGDKDKIKIKYTAKYDYTDEDNFTTEITSIELLNETGYEKGYKNYIITNTDGTGATAEGQVVSRKIVEMRMPNRETMKLKYTYGETLDVSGLTALVIYENDKKIETRTFDQLVNDDHVKVTFVDARGSFADKEITGGEKIDVENCDGARLRLEYKPYDSDRPLVAETSAITVSPATLRISADDKARTYGDENSVLDSEFTYTVDTATLVSWDLEKWNAAAEGEKVNILNGEDTANKFVPPHMEIASDIDEETEIGTYEDKILISGASAVNYSIEYETADLTINKRSLSIKDITATEIAPLRYVDYHNISGPTWKAAGTAYYDYEDENSTLTVGDELKFNDKIKISYNAVYTTDVPTQTVNSYYDVTIDDIVIDDTYGRGKNYTPVNATGTINGGTVRAGTYIRNVSLVDEEITDTNGNVLAVPPKTEYVYGEQLQFNDKNFIIEYDDDSIEYASVIDLKNTAHSDIQIFYDNGSEIGQRTAEGGGYEASDRLNVSDTRKSIVVSQTELYSPESFDPVTFRIRISKRPIRVIADSFTITYGQAVPSEYTYTVVKDDFGPVQDEYEATKAERESSSKLIGWRDPSITCRENNNLTHVSSTTNAGVYPIVLSGGYAPNYTFVYEDGTSTFTNAQLVIRRRPVDIVNILSVPELPAKNVFEYRKSGESSWLEFNEIKDAVGEIGTGRTLQLAAADSDSGIVNGDTINFRYDLRYRPVDETSENKTNVPVDVTYYTLTSGGKEYNYYINSFKTELDIGKVNKKVLVGIEVEDKNQPYTEGENESKTFEDVYDYGENFSLDGYTATYVYDTGERIEVPFKDLGDDGFTVKFTKKNVPADASVVMIPSELEENETLTVSYTRYDEESGEYVDAAVSTKSIIKINKKLMHVSVGDASAVYGNDPMNSLSYELFTYNESDFINGDESKERKEEYSGFVEELPVTPQLAIKTADGAPVTTGTDIGEYTIYVSNADENNEIETANYIVDFSDTGTFEITKRYLTIESVNYIPPLTRAVINAQKDELDPYYPVIELSCTADNDTLTFNATNDETGSGLYGNDEIGINYTVIYRTIDYADPAEVDIEYRSGWLDTENYPKSLNYEIPVPAQVTGEGSVAASQMTNIEIITPPKMAYKYGETFTMSGENAGKVLITYDNDPDENHKVECTFPNLGFYGITAEFEDLDTPIRERAALTKVTHDGKRIKLTSEENDEIEVYTEQAITVEKHQMKIIIDPKTSVYGDDVTDFSASYHYDTSDLVNGDDLASANFTTGLKPPVLRCDVTSVSPVGNYEISGESEESGNYTFVCVPANYTVTKRPVTVESITSGIPRLTSDIIRTYPGTVHSLDGTAASNNESKKAEIYNRLLQDSIGITYTAVYDSVDAGDNVDVTITNIKINDSYGASSNYYLSDEQPETITAKGSVRSRQIESMVIEQQPKLEYTYGETINLDTGRVRIDYDDGTYGLYTFSELPSDTTLKYSNSQPAVHDTPVTVASHNGTSLIIRADTEYDVEPQITNKLIVHKKIMNVDAEDISSVYGDKIQFKWDYRAEDFVNNEYIQENKTSDSFMRDLTEPTVKCVERSGKQVDATSPVGEYAITLSGGRSGNYEFVYNDAMLTITKRPIDITSIESGIPMLTARYRTEHDGPPYTLESSAVNTLGQMNTENVVNDDPIRVTYDVVYDSDTISDNATVGIENMTLDGAYGKSSNYSLSYKVKNASGGKVIDKNIEKIRLIDEPTLTYSYGDPLNLRDSSVRIYYDNGEIIDVPFTDLYEHNITVKYSGTDKTAIHGDSLNIKDYNGVTLEVAVKDSIYETNTLTTNPLQISKRILRYGTCEAEPIVYDGHTTETNGTVIFRNEFDYEPVTVTADFNFENPNAGENKIVNITNIKLAEEFDENYVLESESTTARSTIAKADTEMPEGAITYKFSDETNYLTISAPELDESLTEGGAEYEYSADGGETWQKSPIFMNIDIGQEYVVLVRLADTSNYNSSETTDPVIAKAHTARITLLCIDPQEVEEGEEEPDPIILKQFYTYESGAETEEELREIIGDIGAEYYTMYATYSDTEIASIEYPLEITGDMTFYTTLIAPRRRGGGSGGGSSGGATTTLTLHYTNEDGTEGEQITELNVVLGDEPVKLGGEFSAKMANPTLTWTSGNESVATVDKNGEVTFVGEGTTIITATSKANKTISAQVSVTVAPRPTETVEPTASPEPSESPEPTEGPEPTQSPEPSGNKRINVPYMSGFDGMIMPDNYMTRAEAATIIVQLAGDTKGDYPNIFPDVDDNAWYAGFISQAYARGLISGFEDGYFYPEETVTREQFTAMITRLAALEPIEGETPFTDVAADRWSAGNINAAVSKGIAEGYEDGTFLPENRITRAEAARMANVATGRVYDKSVIDPIPCPYNDLPKSHWAYYEFMIASCEFEIDN